MAKKILQWKDESNKIFDDRIELFLKYIRMGCTIEASCNASTFCKDLFYDAINRAKQDEKEGNKTIDVYFVDAYKKAVSDFQASILAKMMKAGEKQWQMYAWLLERKFPKDYGLKVENNIGGDDKTVNVIINTKKKQNGDNDK